MNFITPSILYLVLVVLRTALQFSDKVVCMHEQSIMITVICAANSSTSGPRLLLTHQPR